MTRSRQPNQRPKDRIRLWHRVAERVQAEQLVREDETALLDDLYRLLFHGSTATKPPPPQLPPAGSGYQYMEDSFTLKSTAIEGSLVVSKRFWGTLRWFARQSGWKAAGTTGADAFGAYDVSGVIIDASDAMQLADALAKVTVEGWTQEQVDLALRVAWLAREGGLVVDHGPPCPQSELPTDADRGKSSSNT